MKVIKEMYNLPKLSLTYLQPFMDRLTKQVIFANDNNTLILYSESKIYTYNIAKEKIEKEIQTKHDFQMKDLSYMELSPNGKYLIAKYGVSLFPGFVIVYDYIDGSVLKSFYSKITVFSTNYLEKVRFTEDNNLIVLRADSVSVFNMESKKEHKIPLNIRKPRDAQIVDNTLIIITDPRGNISDLGKKNKIIYWDIKNNKLKKTIIYEGVLLDAYTDFTKERFFTMEGTLSSTAFNIIDITGKSIVSLKSKGTAVGIFSSYNGRYLTVYSNSDSTSFFDLSFLDITEKEY